MGWHPGYELNTKQIWACTPEERLHSDQDGIRCRRSFSRNFNPLNKVFKVTFLFLLYEISTSVSHILL